MSNNTETIQTNDDKIEQESSTSLFNNVNSTSTPIRLFGQFKSNTNGFSNFGQLSSNGDDTSSSTATTITTTGYFTSTLTKFSSTNTTGGFGSSSTSLAVSLAPLSTNKPLFGESNSSTKKEDDADVEDNNNNDDDDDDDDDDDEQDNEDDDETNKSKPSLLETAAEYEAKRASTHPTATIQGDTSTGEEHEVTKFQMAGKLYMYNPEQKQFVERGYGILKINESHDPSDWNILHARLIMRLDRAFRVILNSPIFPKMTVERATDRSVRFGAQDESYLRIFIIKASTNDCTNLCKELQSRIEIIERQQTSFNHELPVTTTSDSSPPRIRKRSHSNSASDTSETGNDLPKKSKLNDIDGDTNQDVSDEDSQESTKTGEQATAD